jgi:hypothetical protein
MATTGKAARASIARSRQRAPAVDLKGWTRYLSWIFLTDRGRSPRPGMPRLVAVPEPLTGEQRRAAARAYRDATVG